MNGHLLTLTDLEPKNLSYIIDLTIKGKNNPEIFQDKLKNKQIGIIFEKPSTRTRVSLEVGISQMGANAIYLNAKDIQLSRGETISDSARVLSRYLDALVVRTKSHERLQDLAKFSDIPIINGLSDLYHPLQIIADFVTLQENGIDLANSEICFLGDTKNNVCRSLVIGASMVGLSVCLAAPKKYQPDAEFLAFVKKLGAKIRLEEDPARAISSCESVYTDVWISMGDEDEAQQRRADLKPYQLNQELYEKASKKPVILHCLPANKGEEITEEVFESERSRIFDQAENRLHSIKAVLSYCLNLL